MATQYEMELGKLKYFLGIEVAYSKQVYQRRPIIKQLHRLLGEGMRVVHHVLKALIDDNSTMEMISIAKVQGKYLFVLHPENDPYTNDVAEGNDLDENEFEDFVEVDKVEEVGIAAKNYTGQKKDCNHYLRNKRGRPRNSILPTPTPIPPSENLGVVSDNDSLCEESYRFGINFREKRLSHSEYYSEDLDSDVDSDEDKGKSVKFPIFNMPKKMADYKLEVAHFLQPHHLYMGYSPGAKQRDRLFLTPLLC
ncbi:hypothetical protein CR513_04204, partial [Mucuna pruriens]